MTLAADVDHYRIVDTEERFGWTAVPLGVMYDKGT